LSSNVYLTFLPPGRPSDAASPRSCRVLAILAPVEVVLDVRVHNEGGMHWAEVPAHPGLFASGATMQELLEGLGEAWRLYSDPDDSAPTDAPVVAVPTSMQILVSA
jgi:predicted RNase H-like HicB family nuclease